jgi:hypothetical protein
MTSAFIERTIASSMTHFNQIIDRRIDGASISTISCIGRRSRRMIDSMRVVTTCCRTQR